MGKKRIEKDICDWQLNLVEVSVLVFGLLLDLSSQNMTLKGPKVRGAPNQK